MTRVYELPTHLQVEDQLIAGLTARQSLQLGIGLSLVSSFAEIHGGRAWIEDRPGGGSSFRVLLGNGSATS